MSTKNYTWQNWLGSYESIFEDVIACTCKECSSRRETGLVCEGEQKTKLDGKNNILPAEIYITIHILRWHVTTETHMLQ